MDQYGKHSPCKPVQNEDGQRGDEEEEEFVVSTSDTVVYPGTMVVEILEKDISHRNYVHNRHY